jgi:zinc/manganese transport system permease protein
MAVQAVGTLLLFALVVTPAATAIMMTPRPGGAMAIATVISLLSVWLGLGLSAMLNIPPSFTIVTIACAVWFVGWALNGRMRSASSTSDEYLPSPAPDTPALQSSGHANKTLSIPS